MEKCETNTGDSHHSMIKLLKAYLASRQARNYSKASVRSYRYAIEDFISFLAGDRGAARLQDVTLADLDAYRLSLVERGVKYVTVFQYLCFVRGFFNWLEAEQIVFDNPTRNMLLVKPDRKIQYIHSEDQVKAFIEQPDTATTTGLRDRAMIEVCYSAGARLEELMGMDIFDASVRHGTVRVFGKGKRERVVPLGKQSIHWLKQYLRHARSRLLGSRVKQERALWIGRKYPRRINKAAIHIFFNQYSAAAQISPGITPHCLRRACATHMLRRGAHPVQLQILLGHSSLNILRQYLQVSIRDLLAMHRKSKLGR